MCLRDDLQCFRTPCCSVIQGDSLKPTILRPSYTASYIHLLRSSRLLLSRAEKGFAIDDGVDQVPEGYANVIRLQGAGDTLCAMVVLQAIDIAVRSQPQCPRPILGHSTLATDRARGGSTSLALS